VRWSLIVALMLMKAGLIIAVFMHMAWERIALVTAILVPPVALLVLVGMMASEAGYTFLSRVLFFR
jgi:cytochrome c oxidase subunit IV